MADYKTKMCPFLSGGVLGASAGKPASEAEVVSCQGDTCAIFMSIMDESGKNVVGGNCALPLAASALSHLNVNVARATEASRPGSTSNIIAKG